MIINLTTKAIEAAKNLREENPLWSGLDLRVYLSGKGCDGFDYGVTFDNRNESDVVHSFGEVSTLVDPETAKFVNGSIIDWVDDERGRGFLVENPNHKKFRGKFFKRKNWEERLLSK